MTADELPTDPSDDFFIRLRERAADEALFGDSITLDERREAAHHEVDIENETEVFERLIAELAVAELATTAPSISRSAATNVATIPAEMPESLRTKLFELAEVLHAPPTPIQLRREQPTRMTSALAIAACLVIGVTMVYLAVTSDDSLDPAVANFVGSHPAALRTQWSSTSDPHVIDAVSGDVYFDAESDEGILTIGGLAVNDPTREQYQLWIFDADRDERYPVDGGVFDMPTGADKLAVIPIQAKLPVGRPVLFAVTVEKPGGAVVSDRRIALVAKPSH